MKRWKAVAMGLWRLLLDKSPGTVWQGDSDEIRTTHDGDFVRVCFRNHADEPLLLCWVDAEGRPHHFYRLDPSPNYGGIVSKDHVEKTKVGHAFLLATADDIELVQNQKSLNEATILGGYRATQSNDKELHLVTVHSNPRREVLCCSPRFLRASQHWIDVTTAMVDPTPLDQSKKVYHPQQVCGWTVCTDWTLDEEFCQLLKTDLEAAQKALPAHVPRPTIYFNRCLEYGPAACPVKGQGGCFHPDLDWLVENGMSPQKLHCIEFYNAQDYCERRGDWGPGGVLIHETSHAYHHQCLPNGYGNQEILECYDQAMKDGLYDQVDYHGRDGTKGRARAYAATNCMEYWAELSTAFLGGLDESEYNKWYPFHRAQLKRHDPRAYRLLQKLWKVPLDKP